MPTLEDQIIAVSEAAKSTIEIPRYRVVFASGAEHITAEHAPVIEKLVGAESYTIPKGSVLVEYNDSMQVVDINPVVPTTDQESV